MPQAYRAPGVYVQEIPNTELLQLPQGFRIAAVVGTGDTTSLVKNLSVIKGATNGTDTIISTLSDTVSRVTSVGTVPDLAEFVVTTDYTISGNNITWQSGGSQPTFGSTYYVTYRHPKPAAAIAPPKIFCTLLSFLPLFILCPCPFLRAL
jgi:hypothetical protein